MEGVMAIPSYHPLEMDLLLAAVKEDPARGQAGTRYTSGSRARTWYMNGAADTHS